MGLIDADELKELIDWTFAKPPFSRKTIKHMIDMARTVDAVPVIRCKDCRHHYYHELLKQDYCEIPNMQFGEIDPNGYCHRAERREHETD